MTDHEQFAPKPTASWRGLLAPIGKPTGDGRIFADNALSNRDFPLPLRFQREDGKGHDGAVAVGRILGIEYRPEGVWGRGDWLDVEFTPEVAEAQELSRKKIFGPSVDLDDAVLERVPVDAAAEADPDCGCDASQEMAEQPMINLVSKGRICGATLVQIPAFAECAALELSDESEQVDFAAGDPVQIRAETGEEIDHGYFVTADADSVTVVRDNGTVDVLAAWRVGVATDSVEVAAWTDALAASAVDMLPKTWFADPALAESTPLTVTAQGRVYGHLAQWGVCHVGLPGCVTPPQSKTSYAFFHTGEVDTDDGPLEVGKVTLGTGHADPGAGFRAAADHYDNSGACVAVVRAGEDAHGIWVAGALTAGCDEGRIAELRRSPLSGDWRRIGANLELVAALAVNVPGFPVPRTRVAAGRAMSLVAAGVLDERGAGHDDNQPVAEDTEAVFKRLMRKRKRYADLDQEFAGFEADLATERVERAAALLAVLDGEAAVHKRLCRS